MLILVLYDSGPFVEQDGTRSPPSFFQTYVVLVPLLLGIIAPTAGLGLLVWQDDAYLGASTLGVYLVEVAAQLISEGVYLKTSKLSALASVQAFLLIPSAHASFGNSTIA
jgi:hypothetical protein